MTQEGLFRRRRLPHWDVADATYFVTACLAGSVPAQGLRDLDNYRRQLDSRPIPRGLDNDEWELRKHKLLFARFDDLIDRHAAVTHLKNPHAARIVRDSLYHFAPQRYDLLAYVVMPSHLHWVFTPRPEWCDAIANTPDPRTPRERIMHSIKSYTGVKCNRLLRLDGAFWQDESYDHWVRNDDELQRIIQYVELNPVKADLVAEAHHWQFSSAYDRQTSAWGLSD